MSQSTVIGKVAITPQGEFLLGTAYSRLSVVSYQGSSYIAIQDNQNVPVSDTSNWYLLASKGKGIVSIVLQSTSGNTSTYRITYDDNTYFDFDIHNGPDKTSELENDGEDGEHPFITKEVNNLENYELKGNVGTTLEMSMNNSTYVITLTLKNYAGTALATQTIDLPLEGDIVNGSYSGGTLTLTKRNNETITLVLSDLVPDTRTIAGLGLDEDITAAALVEALGVYTQEEVDDLLAPIEQEIAFLESNYDQATTEQSSSLNIQDSLNGYNQGTIVCGNTTQETTTGKNKLNINSTDINTSGISKQITNDELILTGIGSTNGYCGFYIRNVLPNTSYALSYKANSSYYCAYQIRSYDSGDVSTTIKATTTGSNVSYVFTTPADCSYLLIFLYVQAGQTQTYSKAQLEVGSTATSYEQYTGGQPSPSPSFPQSIVDVTGTQEIETSNKNLLKIDENFTTRTSYGITVKNNKNGTYTVTGTSTRNLAIKLIPDNSVLLKANQPYSHSVKIIQGVLAGEIVASVTNQNGTTTYNYFKVSSTTPLYQTKTSDEDKTLQTYEYYIGSSGVSVNFTFMPQLEGSASPTEIVAPEGMTQTLHLGDIHLRGIGDYEDVIFCNEKESPYYDSTLDEGAWYLHQEIGELTLNGTEAWSLNSPGTNTYRFSISETLLQNSSNGYCNSNIWVASGLSSDKQLIGKLNNLLYYRINKDIIDGLSGSTLDNKFKAWVVNNNIICNAPLVTSTNTKITSQNYPVLYADLQELKKMQTYKGGTVISLTPTTGNPALLQVTYWVDEYVSLNNRVTALENRVALLE